MSHVMLSENDSIPMENHLFIQSIIDSLDSNIAVIDELGVIQFVNRGWRAFADSNQFVSKNYGLGLNYLDVCETTTGDREINAKEVAKGIRKVIGGEIDSYSEDYPCHSPQEKRWFRMRASRVDFNDCRYILINHEDITETKKTAVQLRKYQEQLEELTTHGAADLAWTRVENLRKQLAAIDNLSTAVCQTWDINKIYQTVYDQLQAILNVDLFAVSKYDPGTSTIRTEFLAVHGTTLDVSNLPAVPLLEDGLGPQSKVILSGEPLLITDLRGKGVNYDGVYLVKDDGSIIKGSPLPEGSQKTVAKSVLIAPMIVAGETIGVLQLQSADPANYDQQDLTFLTRIANVTAAVVANVDLTSQLDQQILQATALDTVANAIVITDPSGIITWVNRAFTQLTGYAYDEAIGKTPRILRSGKHNREYFQDLWDTINRGDVWHGEIINKRKNGEFYTEDMIITPLFGSAGEITQFIAFKQDISERIKVQKSLLESEERYRQVVERSPMLIAVMADEQVTYINKAGATILGVQSPDQVIGKSLLDFIKPESHQSLIDHFINLLDGDETQPFVEQTIHFSDGRVRDLEISALLTNKNENSSVQIIAMDITDRKRAQETLIRQATLAEIELSINQPLDLKNALERTIDIAKRSIRGNGAAIVLVDHKTGAFWVPCIDMAGMHQWEIQRQISNPDGITRMITNEREVVVVTDAEKVSKLAGDKFIKQGIQSFVSIPLHVENEVLGVLYVFTSEPHRFSFEEIDFLSGLSSRIALVITKVRLYETLLEARIAAEETARAKSEFLANMSHELRTPLTAVVIMADLLRETNLDLDQINYVDSISTSTDKLLAMIDDVLDFSKIEANKLEVDELPFDVYQCVEDALDMVAPQAGEKGLDLAYQINADVPQTLIGDSIRLGQVLINLLSNAVKFTESGEIFLRASLSEAGLEGVNDEKVELKFEIHDTGIGIPAEKVNTLFGVFSQLDSSITRKYGGTGLGLAISKHLVALMGGDIGVRSSGIPGEGSTFHFTIQCQYEPGESSPYLRREQPVLTGRSVLVISDFQRTRQVLADQLRYWGMKVYPFSSVEEAAIKLERSTNLDLVAFGGKYTKHDVVPVLKKRSIRQGRSRIKWIQIAAPGQQRNSHGSEHMANYLETPIKVSVLYDTLMGVCTRRIPGEVGEPSVEPPFQYSNLRILLAEDDPTNRDVILLMLDKMGYQVESVGSGLEVLQIMEQELFDLILMDLQMPEMDGLSATRYIRETLPPEEQPHIIALTADSRQETMETSLAGGVDLFLVKPIRKNVLYEVLQELENGTEQRTDREISQRVVTTDEDVQEITIDENVLGNLFETFEGDDQGALAHLVNIFFNNAPDIVEEIKRSATLENWEGLVRNAHALKGNCELFGAVRLAAKCKEIEALVNDGMYEGISGLVVEIETEFERVKISLKKKIADKENVSGG